MKNIIALAGALLFLFASQPSFAADAPAESPALKAAREVEKGYIQTIAKVLPAFVFIDGGSAAVISPDGYILTNYHVIKSQRANARDEYKKAAKVQNCSKEYVAITMGIDPQGDIALLKLKEIPTPNTFLPSRSDELRRTAESFKDVSNMPYLELADSDSLKVGQQVLAIGNPFDTAYMRESKICDPSVSRGVISALHRFEGSYSDAIQTDASINPGNSGGPLITLEGKLCGINGLIETRYGNAANSGVALAIPSNQIARFLPELKAAKGGRIDHGYIAGIVPMEENEFEGLRGGAELKSVKKGSTAEKLGLQAGDKILKIDNYSLLNTVRYVGVLTSFPAGSEVKLTYQRGNEVKSVQAKLDRKPDGTSVAFGNEPPAAPIPAPSAPAKVTTGKLGISIKNGDSHDGDVILQPAVVSVVDEDGSAKRAGVLVGDRILSINGQNTKNIFTFRSTLRNGGFKPGEKIKLSLMRQKGENPIQVETEVTLQ